MAKQGTPAEEIKLTMGEQLTRIRMALIDRKASAVAKATGLHRNTVRHILKGTNGTPSIETVEKLSKYLFS
jgi:transcriptional regulator with XRE-family HTH domain